MPRLLTRSTALRALLCGGAAILALATTADVSLAHAPARHACSHHRCRHHRRHRSRAHVRVSRHRRPRHAKRRHRRAIPVNRTAPVVKKTTSTPVTKPTTAAPVSTATKTIKPAKPAKPAKTTTATKPAKTPTTTTTASGGQGTGAPPATTSDSQVLFDPVYPSSGESNAVPATGWHTAQIPSDEGVPQPSRIEFTPPPGLPTDPNFPAGNVLRFQLDPYYTSPGVADGDVTDTGGYLANRAEIYGRYAGRNVPAAQWPDPVGSVRWYSFSVYLPAGFPTATSYLNWFDFTQWKGLNSGSPPVAMEIVDNRFVLGGQHSDTTLGHIEPGTWTHFVVGLDFSDSASVGWATVYVNGSLVVDQQPTQTMNDATVDGVTGVDPDYLKMGIYRSKTWDSTQVLYLTPMVIGTTYASVAP